jgi:hypothetical protein
MHRDHKGDANARDPFVPTPPAKQREALKFVAEQILTDTPFDFPPELLRKLGADRWVHWGNETALRAVEYPVNDRVLAILGRHPSLTELGVFSVMWSEHCSYKSSRVWLKTLPTKAPWVICGPGENAGVIDIGDGLAAVFKMESHNHPSFIEPYNGAATGVGGILRDVFTMGARPIANLNALRFGSSGPDAAGFGSVGRGAPRSPTARPTASGRSAARRRSASSSPASEHSTASSI